MSAQPVGASITDASVQLPSLDEIVRTLTLTAGYNAAVVVVSATILGVAAGIVGSFALLRKRALMGDALAHATLPGIAGAFIVAALLGGSGRRLEVLLLGAAASGVLGVVCVQLLARHTRLRQDAAIGIVLSCFFAFGVVLLSAIQSMSVGDQGGLSTFIYGQTAAMLARDFAITGAVALVSLVAAGLLLKEFTLVCFNDDFAAVQGWPVGGLDLAIMALVVLVTVAGLQAVGLLLVVAMLVIPPASARFWTNRVRTLVILSAVLGGTSAWLGASASALLPRLPAGAVIVLTAGVVFLLSMLVAPARGMLALGARRVALRLRISRDHALRELLLAERRDGAGLAASDLAREIGVTPVGGRWLAYRLARSSYVSTDGDALRLTDRGRKLGRTIDRNHRLWQTYLVTHADIAPSHVDLSADLVEHVLSPEMVQRLEQKLADAGGGP